MLEEEEASYLDLGPVIDSKDGGPKDSDSVSELGVLLDGAGSLGGAQW